MNISGVLVQSRPESSSTVSKKLNEIDGVEVHVETEGGHLIVTIENDTGAMFDIMNSFHDIAGVLSTSLIYNNFEDDIEHTQNYTVGESL